VGWVGQKVLPKPSSEGKNTAQPIKFIKFSNVAVPDAAVPGSVSELVVVNLYDPDGAHNVVRGKLVSQYLEQRAKQICLAVLPVRRVCRVGQSFEQIMS
jgi:hypothetical protein